MKDLKTSRATRKTRAKKDNLSLLVFFFLLFLTLFSLIKLGFDERLFEEDAKFPIVQKRVEIKTLPYFSQGETNFGPLERISDSLGPEFLPLIEFLKSLLRKPVVKDELMAQMDSIYLKRGGTLLKLSSDSVLLFSDLKAQILKFLDEMSVGESTKKEILNIIEPYLKPNVELAGVKTDSISRIEKGEAEAVLFSKEVKFALFFVYLIFAFSFGYFLTTQGLYLKKDRRVIVIFLVAYFFMVIFPHFSRPLGKSYFLFVFPASLMVAAFFGGILPAFSMFVGFLLLFFPFFKSGIYESFLINSAFGVLSIFVGANTKKRWDYFIALVAFIVLSLLVSLGLSEFHRGQFLSYFKDFSILSFVSVLLVILLILVFEKILRYPTDFVLLELSNVNHPLLLKLQEEAPGTFEHSLRVSEMGARIAPIIGVSPLLARVAGLYHDIGKVVHPVFFIENQVAGENPHDKLSPEMSVQILKSHVVDGINLAKSYRLPDEVIGVIETHHGTSIMYSFYKKALKLYGQVDVDKFRYPGPKPRNKFEALFMILDGIEASSRALDEKNEKKFRELIDEIIEEKVKDGQFSETDLTYAELEKIKEELLIILLNQYHLRIKYHEDKGY